MTSMVVYLPFEDAVILQAVRNCLVASAAPSVRRFFNRTGTVIHSNLGHAPIVGFAADAMRDVALVPSNLKYDLASGRRGDRDSHIEDLMRDLTGALAATTVNNNAATVLMLLSVLARRKEVPVSHDELIKIGGSCRILEIVASAGYKLVEVGTTNSTQASGFKAAIGSKMFLIMKVHMANYRINGFVAYLDERELAAIPHAHDLPFVIDLDSGMLSDFTAFRLPHEPTPQEALTNGADLIAFSAEKMPRGPQAGMICGRDDRIRKFKKHPMKRALRLDKVTFAGLMATLQFYRDLDRLAARVPVLRMIICSINDIRTKTGRMLPAFIKYLDGAASMITQDCFSQISSGSLPVDRLPSAALAITPIVGRRGQCKAAERLADSFRILPLPVIGRLSDGTLLFDVSCLDKEDEPTSLGQLDGKAGAGASYP